jgi:lipase maturation factor 1
LQTSALPLGYRADGYLSKNTTSPKKSRVTLETALLPASKITELRETFFDYWQSNSSTPLTESLFLRALGFVYFCVFASLIPQITGLIGAHGIQPAVSLLSYARENVSGCAICYLPSLLWIQCSDTALVAICVSGCFFALCLMFGVLSRVAALLAFICFLSIASVGQPFFSFQWDALLLEAGFLAIFTGAYRLSWAYRLLLFRLMFESGWVKLASHDANWRNFHALRFHFLTQPLPNPVAYYAYRLPTSLLDGLTAVTLAIELVAPFFLFAPRVARHVATYLLILLQIGILLTGNYAFFNLLTLALCLWGFDEQMLRPLAPLLNWRLINFQLRVPTALVNLAAALLICLGAIQLVNTLSPSDTVSNLMTPLQPLEITNGYGLFANMTTTRPEIILEGSNDQENWQEYEFPYKPGNTHRGLSWIAPYQPRLDWQMWFAALGNYRDNPWVGGLLYRIMTGEQSVRRLLSSVPFVRPPRYLRAVLYEYEFTSPTERTQTGAVWKRSFRGIWFGPVSLSTQQNYH